MSATHVEVTLWPWLTLELPREMVEGLAPGELADCCDAARCEVVRLLRLRAGGPTQGGVLVDLDTPWQRHLRRHADARADGVGDGGDGRGEGEGWDGDDRPRGLPGADR